MQSTYAVTNCHKLSNITQVGLAEGTGVTQCGPLGELQLVLQGRVRGEVWGCRGSKLRSLNTFLRAKENH